MHFTHAQHFEFNGRRSLEAASVIQHVLIIKFHCMLITLDGGALTDKRRL